MKRPPFVTAAARRVRGLLQQLRDRYRLQQVRDVMVRSRPVFVISTGRTGTKFLEHFLNSFPEPVACRHEPFPDLFDLSMQKIRRGLGDVHEQVLRARARYFAKPGGPRPGGPRPGDTKPDGTTPGGTWPGESGETGPRYVESNPFLSYLIEDLRRAFPAARFIWITRDPATYVTSAYSKSPDGSNKMFFYADDDHRQRITARDVDDPEYADRWDSLTRFDRICWYWNHCNRTIFQDTRSLGEDSLLQLRYEDIFGDNRQPYLEQIARFLDLDPAEIPLEATLRKVNTNSAQLLPEAREWTSGQKLSFNRITREMREQLGYDGVR